MLVVVPLRGDKPHAAANAVLFENLSLSARAALDALASREGLAGACPLPTLRAPDNTALLAPIESACTAVFFSRSVTSRHHGAPYCGDDSWLPTMASRTTSGHRGTARRAGSCAICLYSRP